MATATCEVCTKQFEAKRSDARYCSATCRSRKHRSSTPRRAPADAGAVDTAGVLEQVTAELTRLGKLDTVIGQQAVTVARRLASPVETGSAVTVLSRELSRLMLSASAGADSGDPVDEVTRKRDEKLARARTSSA